MSPYHLQRTFRRLTGMSPKTYADSRRMERMKSRLREGDSVSRATYEAGYTSTSRAYDHARARLGMTPADYRRGGGGLRIRSATIETSAGMLLVAATDRGLCAVTLGDSSDALEAALRREYPGATMAPADAELRQWAGARRRRTRRTGATGRLPLDVHGTAFQWQVWEALQRNSPRGDPATYGEIARAIGRPAAARAVDVPAPATGSRWSFRATGPSAATASPAAIAGAGAQAGGAGAGTAGGDGLSGVTAAAPAPAYPTAPASSPR